MSRQYNCRNKTAEWPYLCRWHVNDGLRARIKVDEETQCWHWFGWNSGKRPALLLKGDSRARTVGKANHLAWWQKTGERIELPYFLAITCSTKNCINPDHMVKSSFKRIRRWSMRDVKRIREDYWGTETMPGRRAKNICCNSALRLTAQHFNVSLDAIYKYGRGKKPRFGSWPDPKTTIDDVNRVMEINRQKVQGLEAARKNALTLKILADEHGTSQSVVSDMLTGHTYKAAGGPTKPVKQAAHKLRVA